MKQRDDAIEPFDRVEFRDQLIAASLKHEADPEQSGEDLAQFRDQLIAASLKPGSWHWPQRN